MKNNDLKIARKLKTPLGSMRWNTELLLQKASEYGLSTEVIDLLKKNYKNNLQAIDTVDDLINVSKIEQGKMRSNLRRFSLTNLLKEIIDEAQYKAQLKSVDIKLRVNKSHRYFTKQDRNQIKEAIGNIIDNAVNYAYKKTKILVSLNRKENFFEIKTSNAGIAIPIHDNDHIFEKFYRAKNAVKSSSDGTGLGLFIAKSFIEKIDGNITFSSMRGKRTIFVVRIPI